MTKRFTMKHFESTDWIYDNDKLIHTKEIVGLLNELSEENEQLKQSNERIVKDIDLALGFIKHKGYSLQDIKDYEDGMKGDVE